MRQNVSQNVRQKRFLVYLLLQVLVILAVIAIFKLNTDVKLASVQAGTLFVVLPMMLLWKEFQWAGFERKSFYLGVLQFWVFFALPILGLRLMNWEANFADLAFLGVPGPTLHRFANTSYLIMIVFTVWNYFRTGRRARASE